MPERFHEIVRRIMAEPGPPEVERCDRPLHPESFGWLRRPDLDQPDGEAWELPDGAVRITASTEGRSGIVGRTVGRIGKGRSASP